MPNSTRQQISAEPALWPIPTLILGVVLLVLAPWSPNLIPSSAVWSDEDAQEYTRASADLHAKSYESHNHGSGSHGHAHIGGTAEERAAAQAAFDAIQTRRDSAGRLPSAIKYALQAIGVAACAAGVWGYFKTRRH